MAAGLRGGCTRCRQAGQARHAATHEGATARGRHSQPPHTHKYIHTYIQTCLASTHNASDCSATETVVHLLECAPILQLLPIKYDALLIRRDALQILDTTLQRLKRHTHACKHTNIPTYMHIHTYRRVPKFWTYGSVCCACAQRPGLPRARHTG
jgi:hypothetical protein